MKSGQAAAKRDRPVNGERSAPKGTGRRVRRAELVGTRRESSKLSQRWRLIQAMIELSDVPRRALQALLGAVASDPDAARMLFIEAMGGGERMREERTRAFGRFERRAEELLALTPQGSPTLDVPVIAVVGALRHIVSRHLRNYAEDELPSRLDD